MEYCTFGPQCLILTCESSVIITASFVRETMFLFRCLLNSLASAAVRSPSAAAGSSLPPLSIFHGKGISFPIQQAGNAAHQDLGSMNQGCHLTADFITAQQKTICQIGNKMTTLYIQTPSPPRNFSLLFDIKSLKPSLKCFESDPISARSPAFHAVFLPEDVKVLKEIKCNGYDARANKRQLSQQGQ